MIKLTYKVDMPIEDQETIINISKYHIGDWAEVYTTDKNVMKRFLKFCEKHSDYGKVIKDDKYSMTFSVHPKCASLYPYAPRKVVLTDEQLEERRERMRILRASQLENV